MGVLRLFLAISVIVTHTTPIFGARLTPAPTAVFLFFIISGFYVQLILTGKYAHSIATFYTNRALRLYPTYLCALALTIFIIGPMSLTAYAIIPNFTLFGSDLLFYFHTPERMIIGPAWSLGIEFWFYLLAPFIARRSIVWVAGLTLASMALRILMEWHQPWSTYFFFPANFFFFGLGMIGRRAMAFDIFKRISSIKYATAAIALGSLTLLFAREIIPGFRNYPWMQFCVLAAGIPFIFSLTARAEWDRRIGELSYSTYLMQAPVIYFFKPLGLETGPVISISSVALAFVAYLVVERPIDRWRQRRALSAATNEAVESASFPISPPTQPPLKKPAG